MRILFISRSTLETQEGGDTVHVKQTAHYLRAMGHEVGIILNQKKINLSLYDFVHFFNLSRPADVLRFLGKKNPPLVISSIYIDYSEVDQKREGLSRFIFALFGTHGFEYVKTIARWLKGKEHFPGFAYLLQGQKASMLKILKHCKHVITASEQELRTIQRDLKTDFKSSKINLGSEHLSIPSEEAIHKEGIISVARIERLKNQLHLIKALNKTHFTLKVIGNAAANQPEYAQKCWEIASGNIEFCGFKKGSDLSDQYKNAKVHAMPSYYETTGLSTLEALKAGCQVVISDRGAQKEIFGDHAFYCNPDNIESIKEAIEKAYLTPTDHSKWVKENFSWEKAAHEISHIYVSIYNNS